MNANTKCDLNAYIVYRCNMYANTCVFIAPQHFQHPYLHSYIGYLHTKIGETLLSRNINRFIRFYLTKLQVQQAWNCGDKPEIRGTVVAYITNRCQHRSTEEGEMCAYAYVHT